MLGAGVAAFMATFSWKKFLLKALPYIIAVAAVVGLGWYIYHSGSTNGANSVQVKWDEEKLENQKALTKLRTNAARKEAVHQDKSQRISDELANANQKYAASVAALNAGYGQRLLNSKQRAAHYQRMSEAGAAERTNLASHAAQLDRSLEEGRQLVQEFRSTIEQRDSQVRALGQQILTDRALTGEKDEENPASAQ